MIKILRQTIKFRSQLTSRFLVSFLMLALFLSFSANEFPTDTFLNSKHTSVKVNELNTKKLAINLSKILESDSKLTLRRNDEIKQKKFFSDFIYLPSSFFLISTSHIIFSDSFLLKPFLTLEILSSRNHPPTVI